ncbi:hypothetical protein Tco_0832328 [Tanacetum coccineum]
MSSRIPSHHLRYRSYRLASIREQSTPRYLGTIDERSALAVEEHPARRAPRGRMEEEQLRLLGSSTAFIYCQDNKLGGQTQEKTMTEEQEDPEKCGESKTRAIIGAMIHKLHEEWFLGVRKDKDDLEGIIDYL